MATRYIVNGQDLTDAGGHRLRVGKGEQGLELDRGHNNNSM